MTTTFLCGLGRASEIAYSKALLPDLTTVARAAIRTPSTEPGCSTGGSSRSD